MINTKVTVEWDLPPEKDDAAVKEAIERSISGYINTFGALPPIGLRIGGLPCDAAKIDDMIYDGIDNSLLVFVEW